VIAGFLNHHWRALQLLKLIFGFQHLSLQGAMDLMRPRRIQHIGRVSWWIPQKQVTSSLGFLKPLASGGEDLFLELCFDDAKFGMELIESGT